MQPNEQDAAPEQLAPEGVFDVAAARLLASRLAGLSGRAVVVDFSHLSTLHDAALASFVALARGACAGPLSFRGLSHHHGVLLRYLGVDPADVRLR